MDGSFSNDFTKDLLRILIKDFTMDLTNFYGFVKKMVQKNQYTYNVPPGSSAPASINEARRAEFDGTDGTGGTGWTGRTEYQKCPLNFFILCGYIDYVYVYLYTKLKLSPIFLWV